MREEEREGSEVREMGDRAEGRWERGLIKGEGNMGRR